MLSEIVCRRANAPRSIAFNALVVLTIAYAIPGPSVAPVAADSTRALRRVLQATARDMIESATAAVRAISPTVYSNVWAGRKRFADTCGPSYRTRTNPDKRLYESSPRQSLGIPP